MLLAVRHFRREPSLELKAGKVVAAQPVDNMHDAKQARRTMSNHSVVAQALSGNRALQTSRSDVAANIHPGGR